MSEQLSPEQSVRRRRAIAVLAAALALLLGLALWRLLGSAPGETRALTLPDDPAGRARLFKKELREHPLAERPAGRKPFRTAYKAWLKKHGASFEETPTGGEEPEKPPERPPVVDFGSMEFPAAPEPTEPERIEPNEMLDEDDLRHPEIYFTMGEQVPEMNRLEERRDTLDFFHRYREQLRRDYQKGLTGGTDPDELLEMKRAMERYDEAIEKLEGLIAEQERREGAPPPVR